jgi:hypothetical protein
MVFAHGRRLTQKKILKSITGGIVDKHDSLPTVAKLGTFQAYLILIGSMSARRPRHKHMSFSYNTLHCDGII